MSIASVIAGIDSWHIETADVLVGLSRMPASCVQCCVSSPPYWGLRDYGIPGQIGLEPTPREYIDKMVAVFQDVRRVLQDDGTLWLNIGDTYSATTRGTGGPTPKQTSNCGSFFRERSCKIPQGCKPKDLIGIPWMLAFALRDDGWYLRQDIIWHKPNPMPESVRDRCTKAHEYVFLLTKSREYFYDSKAIAEPSVHAGKRVTLGPKSLAKSSANGLRVAPSGNAKADSVIVTPTRNKRDVWTISSKPYRGAHFATMPPDLAKLCIQAGTPKSASPLVIDPFNGAATTGVAALEQKCRYIGIEVNPEYVTLSEIRLLPLVSVPELPAMAA